MTWVKICATTNIEDARVAAEAGADALGFIFAPSARRISPKEARRIVDQLPDGLEAVGVFVNQRAEIVLETVRAAGLTSVQLHGTESVADLRDLRRLSGPKLRIYKGLHTRELMPGQPGGEYGINVVRDGGGLVDAFLLDSGTSERRGGTGKTFDWEEAAPTVALLARKHKVIIAGGLNPQNVKRAMRLFSPWGVDVVSGVEREAGKKDAAKVKAFVAAVREEET